MKNRRLHLIIIFTAILLSVLLPLSGCMQALDKDGMIRDKYVSISQDAAQLMMKDDDGHVIVDVRTREEYETGHIPGAICIPNESIGNEMPKELPDKMQIILIYCRSGRRSKEAAEKLGDMGYANVYEFGGIITWEGETVIGTQEEAPDQKETPDQIENQEPLETVNRLLIDVEGVQLFADFMDNSSAQAFADKLNEGSLTVELHDYGNFEKVGPLPWSLPANDTNITTVPGDVILYQGNQITIYYDENTWNFTKIAHIPDKTKDELVEILGDGNVTVTFSLDHSQY